MPSGFDVRDYINIEAFKKLKPKYALRKLKQMMLSDPRKKSSIKINEAKETPEDSDDDGIELSSDDVIEKYRKWLHLKDADCLKIMFGTIFANRLEGDPIWMFLVAPPGGSKSELLMSLSSSKEILTTTSLTPHALVSGATWT